MIIVHQAVCLEHGCLPQNERAAANSYLPIFMIANRAGYESDLAFTKTFKRFTGLPPTAYQKNPDKATVTILR